MILHGFNFSADACLNIGLETVAAVCNTKLGFLAVDGLPHARVGEEDPLWTALGAVADAILAG